MADWSVMDREWPPDGSYDPYYGMNLFYQEKPPPIQEMYPSHAQQYNSCEYNQDVLPLGPSTREPTPRGMPAREPPPARSPSLSLLLSPSSMMQALPPQPMPMPLPMPLPPLAPPHITQQQVFPANGTTTSGYNQESALMPRGDNPREIRNKAEKQRRDKLNHSIAELAAMVPPVVAANRKIDKTGVLRLTAHYLRAHQYVFGDSIGKSQREFNPAAAQTLLSLLNGFLLTTTYKGLVVVVSQNVQQFLGYTELDLLGQNVFNIIHQDDHQTLKENLMPKSHLLGPNGELLIPDEPDGKQKVANELANEKRRFVVRFKKHCQRTEPVQYVSCFVEGTLRKSDRACRGYNRCCQVVRRARARGDNPCSSGNDIVFIGVVRPNTETFITERNIEAFRMEYRTRHSIDGEIMECEQRISLVTGYMTHEVNGANAMNFMHKDDVRWVIFALREMYQQQSLVGESCYRLMAKNGQFIYLRTVGKLDVDQDSRAVRSFVCVNTVVDEQEGKHLVKMMKKKYMMSINNNDLPQEPEGERDVPEDQALPVEDPRNLEKVILYLVTDLPAVKCDTQSDDSGCVPEREDSPSLPLAIIPPRKERILSSIEKIYTVIKAFKREPDMKPKRPGYAQRVDTSSFSSGEASTSKMPYLNITGAGRSSFLLRRQLDGRSTLEDAIFVGEVDSNTSFPTHTPSTSDTVIIPLNPVLSDEQSLQTFPLHIKPIIEQKFDTADIRSYQTSRVRAPPPTIIEVDSELSETDSPPTTIIHDGSNEQIQTPSSSKRKNNEESDEEPAAKMCPNLPENFIDDVVLCESMLNSVMNTIDNDIDPSFPDLLAQEVGDFLDQIENQP